MVFSSLFVSLSGRYAKAMFEIGKEHNILDKLSQDFEAFEHFLNENKNFFPKHGVKSSTKNDLCEAIGSKLSLTNHFISFIKVLLENCRMEMVSNVARLFHKAILLDSDEHDVIVYSSIKLSDMHKNEIKKSMNKIFKNIASIKYLINSNILSGLVIETGGLMLDISGREVIRQLNSYCSSVETI